jgi:hypothetical protein
MDGCLADCAAIGAKAARLDVSKVRRVMKVSPDFVFYFLPGI